MGNKTKIEIKELYTVYDVRNLPSRHVSVIYQKISNLGGAKLDPRTQNDKNFFSLRIENLNKKNSKNS